VEISHIHDQDYNDFHKAVHWCWEKDYSSVIAFGVFGGRIDQTFASLSVATNWFHCHPKMDIILMGQ
jgi:thiamine pyrophosphokinase